MISETTIRKVRELAIEDVLSPYVRLSRKGSTLMGLCPFHTEKTGSFAVTPGKNLFHCFSCNRGGDSITFIMEKENLSFSTAVEFIARNHNIPVEYISEERSEEQMAEARHRESLLTVLDTVQTFFLQNLRATDKEESLDARAYAYSRWYEEFCAFAGIGYAPKDGQAFMDFCRSKALNEELLYELGMFKRGEDGNTYAMFRQRIMIPVRNRWGRIIAYTARYIGDNRKAPKYINSATSMIYSKGETVFGIDRAARLRDAVTQARGEARRRNDKPAAMNEMQREAELLRQFGLFVRENCYYSIGEDDDEPSRISNFIMEPLFHIEDEINGTRIFRMRNMYNVCRVIELKESELCSLSNFQQKVGSRGNYVWLAKIDKLNRVKEYLYSKTDTAERIRKLGWNAAEGFFAFGNGIFFAGTFNAVDELGIVRCINGKAFYIPATSKIYLNNPEIFQFERLMVHENRNGIKLYDYVKRLMEVFGENASVAFCYLLATLFRDIIFRRTRHFPILNLFGEKGTGKTTLATSLQSFFLHGVDPPNLGVTSVPAMNDRVSQAVNTLAVLDEYKNDLDIRKIAYLKGLWGGGGQTKKNTNTDGMAVQTIVTTGVALCGQDKPTQDMALYTRVIFLAFSKTSFNQNEKRAYEDLVSVCNMGLTHLTLEILGHRELFEKNFLEIYSITKRELAAKLENETIHDRIFGNWVIPLATLRTLETVIDVPFSYAELFDTAIKGIRNQNELAQESSEIADFWSMLQGFQTSGKCIEKAHYRIRYMKSFRPLSVKEDIEFKEARPILYLNTAAVASLFNSRNAGSTSNRSNWSTIMSYLKSHASYLGLKQDRFTILLPSGLPDYTIDIVNGEQVKKVKVNRPKALCFDYLQLKETFGLDLETEVVAENQEEIPTESNAIDLQQFKQNELPFE